MIFFMCAPSNSTMCQDCLDRAKLTCKELGVPLAVEKTMGPSTIMPFLGTELDSVLFEAWLPATKLEKAN